MNQPHLTTAEVTTMFVDVEKVVRHVFGRLAVQPNIPLLSLQITGEQQKTEFTYAPNDIGAVCLNGIATFALWTPVDSGDYFLPPTKMMLNSNKHVYCETSEPDPILTDEPDITIMERFNYLFDLSNRNFTKQHVLAECITDEEGNLEPVAETALSYCPDDDEDLELRALEEWAGEDRDTITYDDRVRLYGVFTTLGLK